MELVGADERPAGQAYLNVVEYVCNVGSNTARNSKIHVLAYQSGGIVAIDIYIEMGTIAGSGYHYVSNIEVP